MTTQFNRTAIYISLAIAIAMVVGVFGGAYWVYNSTAKAPVAMSDFPSEKADSAECRALLDALPDDFQGHPRAEIAEPVPEGAAAWASNSTESITLRCGVDLPFQYTEYSQTEDIEGTEWLQVNDMTPNSNLRTWYTTDREPVVAVTFFDDSRPEGLKDALGTLEQDKHDPHPAPLSQLVAGPDEMCRGLEAELPDELAEGYERRDIDEENTYVWGAPGREEIVMRCGVAPPENYEAGAQLQQINDVPWFEDTTLAGGTTAGSWFALGRENDLAVHSPQDVSGDVLVTMSNLLAEHTEEQ